MKSHMIIVSSLIHSDQIRQFRLPSHCQTPYDTAGWSVLHQPATCRPINVTASEATLYISSCHQEDERKGGGGGGGGSGLPSNAHRHGGGGGGGGSGGGG